jgi:hypothetical protein
MAHRRCYDLFHLNKPLPSLASDAIRLAAPRVPMRKRRFDKAFCILQPHGISKCIVLSDANFIEIPGRNDTSSSAFSR